MTDRTLIMTAIEKALHDAYCEMEEFDETRVQSQIYSGYISQALCDDIFSTLKKEFDIEYPFVDEDGCYVKPRINPERSYDIYIDVESTAFHGYRYMAGISRR